MEKITFKKTNIPIENYNFFYNNKDTFLDCLLHLFWQLCQDEHRIYIHFWHEVPLKQNKKKRWKKKIEKKKKKKKNKKKEKKKKKKKKSTIPKFSKFLFLQNKLYCDFFFRLGKEYTFSALLNRLKYFYVFKHFFFKNKRIHYII